MYHTVFVSQKWPYWWRRGILLLFSTDLIQSAVGQIFIHITNERLTKLLACIRTNVAYKGKDSYEFNLEFLVINKQSRKAEKGLKYCHEFPDIFYLYIATGPIAILQGRHLNLSFLTPVFPHVYTSDVTWVLLNKFSQFLVLVSFTRPCRTTHILLKLDNCNNHFTWITS